MGSDGSAPDGDAILAAHDPAFAAQIGATPDLPAAGPGDFWAHLPSGGFIYVPTREIWPVSSVNASLGKVEGRAASEWLAKNRAVAQMIWAPGEPMIIRDRLMDGGGWLDQSGAAAFNLYRAPPRLAGDPAAAGPWIDHVGMVYTDEAEHLFDWFAHRVQRPGEKVNHAIALGGDQGVGKDTMIEPLKAAVGAWNFAEVSPSAAMGRFNGFLRSVVLRISEARDLGDHDRFGFYDRTKTWIAAPPDVHRIDEKNLREYSAVNVCGVIITTNRKDGLHLEPDDRRHFVAWSPLTRDDFPAGYWDKLWGFYANGGLGHVAAWLRARDLASFDPKAPPPKTPAFWEIVSAAQPVEASELRDALDALAWPDAVTVGELAAAASDEFGAWLRDRRNARAVPHRLADVGYDAHRNPDQADGRWKVGGRNVVIYCPRRADARARFEAVRRLQAAMW